MNNKTLDNLGTYPLTNTAQSRGSHHLYYVNINPNNRSFVKRTNKPTLKHHISSKGNRILEVSIQYLCKTCSQWLHDIFIESNVLDPRIMPAVGRKFLIKKNTEILQNIILEVYKNLFYYIKIWSFLLLRVLQLNEHFLANTIYS